MSETKSSSSSSSSGGGSCLGCVIFIIVMWAVIFGVTWQGIHYSMDCSSSDGVQILEEEP